MNAKKMASVFGLASILLLAACVPAGAGGNPSESSDPMATTVTTANLPDLGAAPELQNDVWLNTDHPLRLADLLGQVVLLDMWTFDCINCQHVIPWLQGWQASYAGKGLTIIANHFPEFGYEADLDNLKQAVSRLGIQYAVAQDNDGQTWEAYRTQYWPTLFLIDKRGRLRYQHIGEGAYSETEAAIQALLAEGG